MKEISSAAKCFSSPLYVSTMMGLSSAPAHGAMLWIYIAMN
jgi:hypothetical protein